MTLGNIVAIKTIFDDIIKREEEKFPVELRWKIAKVLLKINPIEAGFEEQKNRLIRKYGTEEVDEKGEKTGTIRVQPPEEPKFFEELNRLIQIEENIELPLFKKSEFGTEVKLLVNDIMVLSPILEMDVLEEKKDKTEEKK
jgi:hypothetical protein